MTGHYSKFVNYQAIFILLGILVCSPAFGNDEVSEGVEACQGAESRCTNACKTKTFEDDKGIHLCLAKCRKRSSKCFRKLYKSISNARVKAVMDKRRTANLTCYEKQDKCNYNCNRRFSDDDDAFDECSDNVCAKDYRICYGRVVSRFPLPEIDVGESGVDWNKYLYKCRVANRKKEIRCIETEDDEDESVFKRCIDRAAAEYTQCTGAIQRKVDDERERRIVEKRMMGMAKCDKSATKCFAGCARKSAEQRTDCRETCNQKETRCMVKVSRKFPLQ